VAGNITNNATFSINRTDSSTLTNTVSGTGALSKSGAGTAVLTAANTYSGGTTINTGVLELGNGGSVAGNITNNATFSINRTDSSTLTNTVSGTGALRKSGTGTAVLTAANTYSGGTLISGGTLQVGNGGTTGSLTNAITNNAALAYNRSDSVDLNSSITGTGQIIQNGTGTLSSRAALTTTNLVINAGTFSFGNPNSLGVGTVNLGATGGSAAATMLFSDNGAGTYNNAIVLGGTSGALTLAANLQSRPSTGTLTFAGAISGTNGLNIAVTNDTATNAWEVVLSGAVNNAGALDYTNTFAGTNVAQTSITGELGSAVTGLTVRSGKLTLAGTNSTYTAGAFIAAGTLEIGNGGSTGAIAGNITNNGTLAFNRTGTLTNTSVISGSGALSKIGSGTLTLSGINSYSGGTSISNGAVSISSDRNLGAVPTWPSAGNLTLDLGKLLVTESFTLNSNRGIAMGTLGGTIEVAIGKSFAYEGVAAGSGALTKSGNGTLTLSGANTYTGATTVSAGTLELANAGGSALDSIASLSVASGATLLVSQSNQVGDSAWVSLSGGTIQRASGVSEVFGSLNLTASSFLDFSGGTAGTITFSGINYTPSSLLALDIANFNQGSTLVFQTTNNLSLTGFTFSGTGGFGGSTFDGNTFTITAIPEPATLLAALGLAGLLLYPRSKRILGRLRR